MVITSLNRSKELVEAGWVEETHFRLTPVWDKQKQDEIWIRVETNNLDELFPSDSRWLPAPTLDELLEALSCKASLFEHCGKTLGGWIFTPQDGVCAGKSTWSENICDTVAWTWILMNKGDIL